MVSIYISSIRVQGCRYQRIFHHDLLHYRLPGILEQAAGTPVPKESLALETMGIECRILWITIIKAKDCTYGNKCIAQ